MTSTIMEEFELMKDAKYRLYVSAVDKALKSFENYSDWPDLIHSLTKLNKVIRDNQRFPVIPRRIKISKRLAQCMHKTWPAGVHLKALEVYDTIFKCMGTNRISDELFIYSAGLFPALEFSSISVKSPLLAMYETHFVPLGPRLLPGLSGFLSGVLPGLEEGSDHFERTNLLLEKVSEGVGAAAFYGCLWQCVASNSAVRLPAVTFVLSHISKSQPIEDQRHIMGTSIDIMVKALCAGVQDSNALVQRTTLDLLLVAFPMHSLQLTASDVVRLVTAALSAILRRDVSLNRRLYSWLLGSELHLNILPRDHPYLRKIEQLPDLPRTTIYFDLYSRQYLIEGVRGVLMEMNGDIRPYRLLTSLLDRSDVGPVVLDDFLFDVLRVLYSTSKSEEPLGSPKRKQDIIKSANLFFSSLESWYIWQYLGSLFDRACRMVGEDQCGSKTPPHPDKFVKPVGSGIPDVWEVCELSEFLLSVIPTEASVDCPGEHLMNLLLRLVALLTKFIDHLTNEQLVRCLRVCRALIRKFLPRHQTKSSALKDKETDESVMNVIRPSTVRLWIGKEKPFKGSTSSSPEPDFGKSKETAFEQTLRTFLKDFLNLFVAFVGGGRIINSNCVPRVFEKLTKSGKAQNEMDADELQTFLTDQYSEAQLDNCDSEYRERDLVVEGSEAWSDCFDIACEILVEVSSFPSNPAGPAIGAVALPPWVKTILVCCCYLERSPKLQLTAIRTFLDLLQLSEAKKVEGPLTSTPLLDLSQIVYIQKSTCIVKVITEVLWNHLGTLPPHMQITCTELLHQLLNTLTAENVVETLISDALVKGDESMRILSLLKFIKIWTTGRELQDGKQKRCFQSCLLKVLDNMLLPDNSPLRLQTESWLSQALLRGDMARLLDPLLLILLDASSARLGILHVSIEPSSATDISGERSSNIYTISSVEGDSIYHVSDRLRRDKNGFKKRLKWRWKKDLPPLDQSVKSPSDGAEPQLHFTQTALPRPASLFVNPMSLSGQDDDEDEATSQCDSVEDILEITHRIHSVSINESVTSSVLLHPPSNSSPDSEKSPVGSKNVEAEDSVSADEFFGSRKVADGIGRRISKEIIDSVVEAVVRKLDGVDEMAPEQCDMAPGLSNMAAESSGIGIGVHPLHSHLLLYCGAYDATRTLYAFNALRDILRTNPRLFLCCSATSGTVNATYPSDLLVLLARHRKSVYGRGFDGPMSAVNEYISAFRSSMYLEVLISLCLNYARSYYPNLGHKLSPDVLAGNRSVQLTSIETLTELVRELIPLVRDSGKMFASYIATILSKCKVQKNILHCVMSSLNTIRHQLLIYDTRLGVRTFTEEIIDFNDAADCEELTEHSRAVQVQLLKLLLALIQLEYDVDSYKAEPVDVTVHSSTADAAGPDAAAGSTLAASYSPGYLIPQQPLFFRAIASALSLKGSMRALHSDWTQLVTSSLPYLGAALPQIVMTVVNQLCVNLEELAQVYANPVSDEDLPPDYVLTELEALTVLCHFCVLDPSEHVSPLAISSGSGSGGAGGPPAPGTGTPAHIFSNLVHVFTPLPLMQMLARPVAVALRLVDNGPVVSFLHKFSSFSEVFGSTKELSPDRNQQLEIFRGVRLGVLKRMPRMISSLAALWTSVAVSPPPHEITLWGCPKVVRNQILEFLSPLSVHHGPYFLAAMAVTWHERRDKHSKQVLPTPTSEQQVLVNLLGSIKVLPIDTFVQTIHAILKQPPSVEASLQDMSLEVSVLELFYVYMQTTNCAALAECWASLLALMRDSLLLQPPALFLVLAILNEFVQRSPAFQEKKDQRDLQDITAKLIEGCAAVAGTCLEQTTWLKRNLSLRDLNAEDEGGGQGAVMLQQSAHAQLVLAHLLAALLDVSYGSQEKEKVATLLISVMLNVTPYLKNHQARYAASFLACSQLLASISGYPYTRKAWKKDAFDLLLDPALFQMEPDCLPHWTTIVDNLMTHDQTTFNDLMGCIPAAPSGSYSLFSSRDQEYEQRAQMLKRLAFVIMCSDKDQYCKSIIPIQDRLSESLRLPSVVPSIPAQVFFCFRVLLLRMSSDHVDALWSLIISEMVQVFMHIEQELARQSDEFNSHIRVMSALDSSWVVNSSNGLNAHGHPHWLLLTLAAAKLLDLAVLLPAHLLPQFQMYRWAFVADKIGGAKQEHEFIPHVKRICKLMDEKFGPCEMFVRPKEGHLLLTESSIDSLQALHPFFHSLQSRPKSTAVDMEALERHIFHDFLDKLPTSPSQ